MKAKGGCSVFVPRPFWRLFRFCSAPVPRNRYPTGKTGDARGALFRFLFRSESGKRKEQGGACMPPCSVSLVPNMRQVSQREHGQVSESGTGVSHDVWRVSKEVIMRSSNEVLRQRLSRKVGKSRGDWKRLGSLYGAQAEGRHCLRQAMRVVCRASEDDRQAR